MSDTLRTILVAVDFGDASARAVGVAGLIAERTGAALRLVHAERLEAPPYFTASQLQAIEGEARANQKRAADYLRAFGRKHTPHPFEVQIESRAATDAILHASADADLVVMGTHGRSGPSRWWLGSVAERVLRETAVPLLVVHADGRQGEEGLFKAGLIHLTDEAMPAEARRIARLIATAFDGRIEESGDDDVRAARAAVGATWAAIPAPSPRSGAWLSAVGEPLIRSCAIPVLFVPEAAGGPTS